MFWESYKAKCEEKGIDAGTFEQFEKRQATPPTFSSDMLVELKKSEPNAGTFKEVVPKKRGVGRPPKIKPQIEILSDEPLHVKDVPLLKEPMEKRVSMSEEVLHEIIIMAYERGVMQAESAHTSLIVEADVPMILDDILGGRHVQSV